MIHKGEHSLSKAVVKLENYTYTIGKNSNFMTVKV